MPRWEGFAYAAAAAIGHSCIDTTRKIASQRFSSTELVGLVGVYDALFLTLFVTGSGLLNSVRFVTYDLIIVLIVSAILKILCALMYQRALQVSPLSATVPFLAFTPALIIFTSYVMIGELPSLQGLAGVMVVTIGGYMLAFESARFSLLKKGKLTPVFPSSPLKGATESTVSKGPSENGLHSGTSSFSEIVANISGRLNSPSIPGNIGMDALEGLQADLGKSPESGLRVNNLEASVEPLRNDTVADNGKMSPIGLLSGNGWAASPHVEDTEVRSMKLVDDLEAPLLPRPDSRNSTTEKTTDTTIERPLTGLSRSDRSAYKAQTVDLIADGDADGIKETSKRWRASSRLADKGKESQRLGKKWAWAFLRLIWSRVGRLLEPLLALRREEGSGLMLGCAGLLSLTNSLDKMGSHMTPSILVFASLQRICMAVPPVIVLGCTSPRSFYALVRFFPVLASISFFEILAIVGYLKSLEYLLVSYSVATKRTNILISVFVGNIVFKEDIWRRLPYILLMMTGMTMIVFA